MQNGMKKQRCLRDQIYTFDIESHTNPDLVYEVIVLDPFNPDEAICECEGYKFRGHCPHQQEAFDQLCSWKTDPLKPQTPAQRRHHICPLCGSQTGWIEDDD